MDFLLPFISVVGVIIGFLLSTLKEWIQNKPKIKMELKTGEFNYFITGQDESGQFITEPTYPKYADEYRVRTKVDIYNYGKGNTAIKSIHVTNILNRKTISYSEVILKIDDKENIDYSFNLPSSNIMTMNLSWNISKDEQTESLFSDNIIQPPREKHRLKFEIVAIDIKNKKHKLLVEPLSIFTAQEYVIPEYTISEY